MIDKGVRNAFPPTLNVRFPSGFQSLPCDEPLHQLKTEFVDVMLIGIEYAPEFRRQMIELVRAGRTPEELAKEFEPSAQAIRNWVAQADRDEGRREDGLTTAEREELNRLRRENRQLKLERDILSKAAAWFARETDVIPPKGSNS